MHEGLRGRRWLGVCLMGMVTAAGWAQEGVVAVQPGAMARVGSVEERFQSYNIEMLEVTGGRFWKPYGAKASAPVEGAAGPTPAGMSADLYAYRPPKDLGNARLRKLAAALGPAYVRVSGTWANSTYLPAEGETIEKAPAGYNGVLTRAEWKGVVDFAGAAHAELVTSFATSVGTRDAGGVWTTGQADRVLEATRAFGGRIAAAEYMNEPTFAMMGGAPKGYSAADYGRDFRVFREFMKAKAPEVKIAGPGSVGESADPAGVLAGGMPGFLPTPALLEAMGKDTVDVFSYHAYGGVSERCKGTATREGVLSEEWMARTDGILAFYKKQRDLFDPGKPLWLTETGETACGGDPWAATFLDSFRYLDQLGRLAKGGVQVVMHNTLAASDYGLLDEATYEPRPNYWAALLWRRLMGTTVLEAGVPLQHGLHVYAHCLRDVPGGVALLVIENDKEGGRTLRVPVAGERYTMSAAVLDGGKVMLNGKELGLGRGDRLPVMQGVASAAGEVRFGAGTITFLALKEAGNSSCR